MPQEALDVLDLLLEDHGEFRMLLDELDRCEPEFREDLFRYTVARLAAHEAAEQAVIHDVVRDTGGDGHAIADARVEEEEQAEELLADMSRLDPASAEFEASLSDLRSMVLSHADREERHEFPILHSHLDRQRRQELGTTFRMLRDAGPTRPHPNTPTSPGVRAVAGPVAGVFDRARDKVRDAFTR